MKMHTEMILPDLQKAFDHMMLRERKIDTYDSNNNHQMF